MKKVNPRNPRTTRLKRDVVSPARDAVLARDARTYYESTLVLGVCFYHFTPRHCMNRANQVHEVRARGKTRREAQAKFFVPENQVEICFDCESYAQTVPGAGELQAGMAKVFGYKYDEAGYWESYYRSNAKGIV